MKRPRAKANGQMPFWRRLTLEEMSAAEWESLCDGCGLCCLNKLEYWDTGAIAWTDVACRLFDDSTCRCTDYRHRSERIPDCETLTPEKVRALTWLPPSCAYRLVAEGRDLYWWHPLVSGDPETVHLAGISARHRTRSEEGIPPDRFEDYVVDWPGADPAPGIETKTRGKAPKQRGARR